MKNLSVAVLAILAVATLIAVYPADEKKGFLQEYTAYMKKYNKKIDHPEQLFYRASLFNSFLHKMQQHNSDSTQTWKMGINQFSDLTDDEFIATYLGELPSKLKTIKEEPVNAGFAGTVDWRTRGIVTPIKNQGQCGSCWAFAATAAHESYQIQVRHQPSNITLSEQQLVDCSTGSPYGNEGCNGGYGVRALEYIKDFGQTTNASYPYKAANQACQNNTGVYRTYGVSELAGCSEIDYEIQRRPMAVRVDASNWKSYASGVFNSCATNLNHAVFLVGSSDEAWTIKNSWSPAWGEQGFIRLAKGNTCGVCTGPSFPI
jgi:C1A family cysteine protease